jgi:hypothetical protein
MVTPDDSRHTGWLGGRVIPVLTGIVASGILLAATVADPGGAAGAILVLGGAALIGLIVGNPGNEALVLAGIFLPGLVLIAVEPHHGCIDRIGPFLVVPIVIGIGLMLVGLTAGIIVGRERHIGPARPTIAAGALGATALIAVLGWVALGFNLSRTVIC